MDFKEAALKEAAQYEAVAVAAQAKAAKLREAAALLDEEFRVPKAKLAQAAKGRGKGKRVVTRHRLHCSWCKRGFVGCYAKKTTGGPFCSSACRAHNYRAAQARALVTGSASLTHHSRPKPTVLVPGDGVSKGL